MATLRYNKKLDRMRKRDAMEMAQRMHGGKVYDQQPAAQVAARKRIEDINLAREIGVPVEEIL